VATNIVHLHNSSPYVVHHRPQALIFLCSLKLQKLFCSSTTSNKFCEFSQDSVASLPNYLDHQLVFEEFGMKNQTFGNISMISEIINNKIPKKFAEIFLCKVFFWVLLFYWYSYHLSVKPPG